MWDRFIDFVCRSKWVTPVVLSISLLTPISYHWSKNLDELIPYGDVFFQMGVNIAYGIIASYIFYFINIYIPSRSSDLRTAHTIALQLHKMKRNARTLYNRSIEDPDTMHTPFTNDRKFSDITYKRLYNIALTAATSSDIKQLLVKNFDQIFDQQQNPVSADHHEYVYRTISVIIDTLEREYLSLSPLAQFTYNIFQELEHPK